MKKIIPPSQRNNKNYLWDAMGGIGLWEIIIVAVAVVITIIIMFAVSIKIGIVIGSILILIAFMLIRTDSKTGQKFYSLTLRSIYFLSYKKSYSKKEVEKLLKPYKFNDEEEWIKVGSGNNYLLILKINGQDIDKLSYQEREELIENYSSILRGMDIGINFYKENSKPDNSSQIEIIKSKIDYLENEENLHPNSKKVAVEQLNGYIVEELEKSIKEKTEYKIVLVGPSEELHMSAGHLVDELESINIKAKIIPYEEQKKFINNIYSPNGEMQSLYFGRNHIKQGDKYIRFVSLGKKPLYANDAWFATFCSLDNVAPVLKLLPIKDQEGANRNLDKAIQNNEIKISRIGRISAKQKNELFTINEIYREIIEGITSDSDKLMDLLSLMKIEGESINELNKTERELRKIAKVDGFGILSLPNIQFKAFESFIPKTYSTLRSELSIEVPSITAASTFPYIVDDFIDEGGIYISDTSQGGEIYWNNEIRDDYRFNSNAIILGSSGSGKSVTTYKLVLNDYLNGNRLFIIDPEQEYKQIAKELEGQILNMGGGGKYKINPLKINYSFDEESKSHIKQHISFLKSFFETTNKSIEQDVSIILQKELIQFYEKLKITDDLISNEKTYSKIKWPIFDDFQKFIDEKLKKMSGRIKDIYEFASIILSQYSSGGVYSELWNNQQDMDFKERLIIFDTSSLINDKYKIAGQMLFITKIIWTSIQENKRKNEALGTTKYTSLFIDEAHLLMNKNNLFALEWMQMVTKRIRKYNGKIFLITQNVKDFLGDKDIAHYTEGIINNISYSFIGKMQPKDLESLDNMYSTTGGLTEAEKNWIIHSGRGKFLLKIGDRLKYFIEKINVNPMEAKLFSNDILKTFDPEYSKLFINQVEHLANTIDNGDIVSEEKIDLNKLKKEDLLNMASKIYLRESLLQYTKSQLIDLLNESE